MRPQPFALFSMEDLQRAVVPKASASRHQGDSIKGSPKSPQTLLQYSTEGYYIEMRGTTMQPSLYRGVSF